MSGGTVYVGGTQHVSGRAGNRSHLVALRTSSVPPFGLVASAGAGGAVTLTWDSPPGATGYRVYGSLYPGGPFTTLVGTTFSTSLDVYPPCGGSQYYIVRSYDSCGESADSNVASATGAAPPATITPDGPTTFCSGGSVTLTANAGASYLWSTGETAQSITAATAGSYSVTVTYANGCTAASAPVTVTVIPSPVAPTLNAPDTSGNNTVVLTWTPTAFTDQHLLRSEVGGPEAEIATPSGGNYTDTSVTPGVEYTYRIRVDSESCGSAFSNAVTAVPSGACLLAPSFAGLTSVASSGATPCALVLSWSAATPQCVGGGPVTYTIYRGTSSSFTPSASNRIALGVTATTFTDNGNLAPNATYYYIVRAVDASNGAEDTNTVRVSGTPTGCTASAPNPVAAFTATAGDGRVLVQWVNPLSGQYAGTRVLVRTDGTFPVSATDPDATVITNQFGDQGQADSYMHPGLVNGTTYHYAAFVDNGFGQYSGRATCTARPQELSSGVEWVYNAGAAALAPVGIYTPGSSGEVGTAFIVANDRMLHAADATTELLGGGAWPSAWLPLAMNGPSQARPTIVDATLGIGIPRTAFVSSQDGYVYCVNAATGQLQWTSPKLGDAVQAAPVGIFRVYGGAFDLVVVGVRNSTGGSKLYGLKLSDGTVAWAFENTIGQGGDGLPMGIISSGASLVYGSPARAYFTSRTRGGGSTGTVWCVSFTETGVTKVWSRSIGDVDSAVIPYNGRLYVGTNAGNVYALDPATGADAWTAPLSLGDGPVKRLLFPAFGTNRLILSTTTKVWSVSDDGGAGSVAWSTTAVPNPSAPLVLFGTPYVYVGGSDGKLHQLVTATGAPGNPAVQLGSGASVVGAPSYDNASGLIYVGTDAGRIYAVRPPQP